MRVNNILTGNYRKAFLAICAIGLGIIILLLIPAMQEKKEYYYSIDRTVEPGNGETVLYEAIELPVGIYSVRVNYHTTADFEYVVRLTDDSMPPLRVMQNDQILAAAHSSEEFHLWLFGRSENLTLSVSGESEQEIYFEQVCITETGQLWYSIIFGSLMLILLILGCIACAAWHHVHKIPASGFVVAGLIVLLTYLLSRPYLMNWILSTGDTGYHIERIDGVANSIVNGVFPMRLEANFPLGYGYADGILYGSTLLYIPAILWLIGFPVLYYYNIFIILINFATILVAFYCFGRMFQDKYIGLMCSALYAFSLYRITVLFERGCLGEGCAQIFLPLLLYGYYRMFTDDTEAKSYKNIWLILVIGYSGVLQSHTLTCELALIWTGVICLVNVRRVFRKTTFIQLVKGAVFTLLCNAWYAVPFLDYYFSENLMIKHTGQRLIQHEGITLREVFIHFFDGVLEDEQGMTIRAVGPGLIPMLALFAFLGLAIYALVKKKKSGLLAAGAMCAVLSLLCIVFSLRTFPWNRIQQAWPIAGNIISSLQFPTRFLNWGTLFMVPVFGYCLWYAKYESKWKKPLYAVGATAAILAVGTSSLYLINQINLTIGRERIFDNNQLIGYVSGGEYIIYGTDMSKLSYSIPLTSETVQLVQYDKGDLAADFRCSNSSFEETGYVEVPLFLYKGYRAETGAGERLTCVYGNNNVIRVLIPPKFNDTISVRFVSPVYWRISEACSALAWLAILIYCARTARGKHDQGNANKSIKANTNKR